MTDAAASRGADSAGRDCMPLPSRDERRRAAALSGHGASASILAELLAYGATAFDEQALRAPPDLPLPDEPFVGAWAEYLDDAQRGGVLASLRRRLVQLRFPIRAGMSEREDYRRATLRGQLDDTSDDDLQLARPDDLQLFLHPTPAGRIPVLVAGCRADFVSLIQALTRRNEPAPIPESMGACIVGGYNNWDRVRRLRDDWQASGPADASDAGWSRAFSALLPRKELYQDRFIVVSTGTYSATPAEEVGVAAERWESLSATIRLEHECTHYFTRRLFGSMRNTLFDELCADYGGIVAATGAFQPDWFLRFVGLEHPSRYRAGGRLENYRGTPALSDGAFELLQQLVRAATAQLAQFDRVRRARGPLDTSHAIIGLARVGLEPLASDDGWLLLDAEVAQLDAHAGQA